MFRLFMSGSGSFAGAVVGLLAAFLFADPICWLFGVGSFDGASGVFTLFYLAPFLTILGFVIGAIFGAKNGREPKQSTSRLRDIIHNDDVTDAK